MSPLEILQARRRAQITGEGITAKQAQALARRLPKPAVTSYRPEPIRLQVTAHARQRMQQRGVSMRQVSLIFRFGHSTPAMNGCTAYQIRRDMVGDHVPQAFQREVSSVLDTAIVVATDPGAPQPTVVTVIRGEVYGAEW
jgi:alpha-beta hydrolase superfamily lysophospholipase